MLISFLLSVDPSTTLLRTPDGAVDAFAIGTGRTSIFDKLAKKPRTARSVAELRSLIQAGNVYVRLPAGIFDVSDLQSRYMDLPILNGTVIEGAGKGKTVIVFGSHYSDASPPVANRYGIGLMGTDIGLKNLTIRNANRAKDANWTIRGNGAGGRNERLFFDNVDFELGNGRALNLNGPTDALIRGCRIVSRCMTDSVVVSPGAQRLRVVDTTFDYRAGRTSFTFANDTSFLRIRLRLDHAYRHLSEIETGGLELSMASNVTVSDSNLGTYNGQGSPGNDYEIGVMTQLSNLREYQGVGRISAPAAGLRLRTDLRWRGDAWLNPGYPVTRRKALFVLSGRGAGQWRWAAPGPADGDVLIDRPWDRPPAKGDVVCVSTVSAYRLRVLRNTITGGNDGVNFYNGSLDCEVRGNVFIDTFGVLLRSDTRSGLDRSPHSNTLHLPTWGTSVVDNEFRNVSGRLPAGINVYDNAIGEENAWVPRIVQGVRIVNNSIIGRGTTRGGQGKNEDGVVVESNVQANRTVRPAEGRIWDIVLKGNSVSKGRLIVRSALSKTSATKK